MTQPTPTPLHRRSALLLLALAAAALAALAALPSGAATAAEKRYAPQGVGAGGYDPVAYFTDGKAVPGSEQFTASHEGVSYRFASPAHRDLFAADPERYLPRYGGYCAYAAAKGALAPTDPQAFTVKDGKLLPQLQPGCAGAVAGARRGVYRSGRPELAEAGRGSGVAAPGAIPACSSLGAGVLRRGS
jgi:YHS domain-containing protein